MIPNLEATPPSNFHHLRDTTDARERATLLCIIGALVQNAKLDLSHPMKAAEAVAAMLPGDVKVSARTIGEHLKGVPGAMNSRKA